MKGEAPMNIPEFATVLILLSRKITKPTGSFRLERRECDSL